MKIVIDAFGGDNAPNEVIKAARKAKDELQVEIVLCGDESKIKNAAKELSINIDDMEIIHTAEVFDIHEQPSKIIKEGKNTSLAVGLKALKDGKGDAFLSAGSSGGLIVGASTIVGRIRGIKRPSMSAMLPTISGRRIMLTDAGANAVCRPEMLLQFAIMGSAYMKCVKGIENPKVGLLNIGAEETKGRDLELETYQLLKNAPINFIGNAEAREVPTGNFDVIVSDGFSGNVVLKLYEGMGSMFKKKLKGWFSGFFGTLSAILVLKEIKEFQQLMDYKSEGGGIILGVSKPVIKAHGSSDQKAFYHAIRQAKLCVEGNMIAEITRTMEELKGV